MPFVLPYEADRLAGFAFMTDQSWCYFRAECGFEFNHPLSREDTYAVIDPETGEFIGVRSPTGFIGPTIPPVFRVLLLRPISRSSAAH